MLDMALRNIWQRKTRSLLTILGIGLAVMLYVYMSVIMNFYNKDLERQLSSIAGKVVVSAKSEAANGFPTAASVITIADAEAVLRHDGIDVSRSTPVLLQPLVNNPAPNMPPLVQAVGLLPGRETAYLGDSRVEGSAQLTGPDDAILGAKAAEHYKTRMGDQLVIQDRTFRVVGVVETSFELLNNAVIIPLQTAQETFIRPGVVSLVYVTASDPSQVDQLAKSIQDANSKLQAVSPGGMSRSVEKAMSNQRAFFAGVKSTIIAVSLIMITIVMIMAVADRKKEIGTLKALGAGAWTIIGTVAAEALVLSLAGGVLSIPVSWLRLEDKSQMDFNLALQTVLLAAFVGAAAAIWPAVSAVGVDPLESLRHE